MAILHYQYWLLKEFCILSFEKNLNIVIDFSIIYKSIKKLSKLLSPPKGFFFLNDIFLVMNYWIMILVICGFFVVLYWNQSKIWGANYRTNILKFFKEMVFFFFFFGGWGWLRRVSYHLMDKNHKILYLDLRVIGTI